MDDRTRAHSALNALDPGTDRENWVRIGMAAKSAGLSLDDFTAWSSQGANFDSERDCAKVWRSFSDGAIKAATLFSLAFATGWKDPTKTKRHDGHRASRIVRQMPTPIQNGKTQSRAGKSVVELWARFEQATEAHGYIRAKRGRPDGLRVVPADDPHMIARQRVAGWLVVPAYSLLGELRTLQFIPPPDQGKKLNLQNTSFEDGMFVVGDLAESDCFYIVEGIGQAWACWGATGKASVVCFGAGRLETVANTLRAVYAERRLILVPDRGKESQAEAIARVVRGEWVELPQDKPANYDANDYALEHGADELAELLQQTRKPAMRYQLLAASDLFNLPPLRWLVRGVLPAQGLAALYGASGSGKSFLALDLCAAVAAGHEWFGCRVNRVPVAYVALEGEAGFAQRVRAWQLHLGHDLPAGLRFVMQPCDLRSPDDVGELADAVMASGGAGGLLVIDTLNRAAPGMDENSSQDMGELIDAAKTLQAKVGGLVLLVHHTGKDHSKGLRGHSSLHAALDAAIEVTRTEDRRDWRIAKAKDGNDGEAHPFRLVVVEIGQDEDGDIITSCCVEADDRADALKRVKLPQGPTQKRTHEVLGELLRNSKYFGKAGAPASRPCVELEAAVLAAADHLTCRADQRQYQARRALTAMVDKGMYQVREGWLWDCQ